jgi:glyoxylase-like metal-dependent hydrolase (beta-lactamase superfamily II)
MVLLAGLLAAGGIPSATPPHLVRLAPGVYAALGDTGRGSEGQPNAGFVVTGEGVVVIDALASPQQGRRLVDAIRRVTDQPIRWLVLTHHHPDHHFGAVVFRRLGARVMAHPDRTMLAMERGEDALVADWVRVVGLDAMRGFEFADTPDRPVTGYDTLKLGGRTLVIGHPGPAHSPGDLMLWLPDKRILFAGDLRVEDGVTMVVDGSSAVLLRALAIIDSLKPRIVVPGHGALPRQPLALVVRTRDYITRLQADMRAALERGVPLGRALRDLPPPDQTRPVSYNSRRRRNAVRVYLEEERIYMGLDSAR